MINGVTGTHHIGQTDLVHGAHPPVIVTKTAEEKNGTLSAGLLVALNEKGNLVAYDRAGQKPLNVCAGVLTEELNTEQSTSALVLVHGTVRARKLIHGTASATDADIITLEEKGIFAI